MFQGKVVMLVGNSGVGKDLTARFMQEVLQGASLLHVADPLYKAAGQMFRMSEGDLASPASKHCPQGFLGLTPKEAVNRLTSMFYQEFGDDFFLKQTQWRINGKSGTVIMPDVRDLNIYQHFAEQGAVTVRVIRPGFAPKSKFDNLMELVPVDHTLVNDAGLLDLRTAVKNLAVKLK